MMVKIADALRSANKIAIFTHTNPDGDALGSSFAMQKVLKAIGKDAVVYLEKDIPEHFSYLEGEYTVGGMETKTDADTALVLDCANFERIGDLADTCKSVPKILCVDHHFSGEDFGDLCLKEPDSAATAQIVYKLACLLTDELPEKVCEAIYTGISTDTGHFKFSNVTEETLFVASKLVGRGINHRKITEILYDTVKREKLIFLGKAAEEVKFFADGKGAILVCPEEFIGQYGLKYEEAEELTNLPLRMEGVLASILVKDKDENSKRVSLRGKDFLDLSEIAEMFGGGGHKNAAAFVAKGDIDKILEDLMKVITEKIGDKNV